MVQGPPHVVWREGMRCVRKWPGPQICWFTGLPSRGPARVPSRAHPHFTGSGAYRTQVVRDSEAVSLPPAVSCPLIPAGIASFLRWGQVFTSFPVCTPLPVSVQFCLLLCVHTYCTLTQATRIPFPPWDIVLPDLHLSQRQFILHISH